MEAADRGAPARRQQLELLDRRDDVERAQALDALGVVERRAVRDTPAAVVADDGEALVAERRHDGDDVARPSSASSTRCARRRRAACSSGRSRAGPGRRPCAARRAPGRRGATCRRAAGSRAAARRASPLPAVRTWRATPSATSMLDSWNPSIVTPSVDHAVGDDSDPELLAAPSRPTSSMSSRRCAAHALAGQHEVALLAGLVAAPVHRHAVRLVAEPAGHAERRRVVDERRRRRPLRRRSRRSRGAASRRASRCRCRVPGTTGRATTRCGRCRRCRSRWRRCS